jgi:hypothetical protein
LQGASQECACHFSFVDFCCAAVGVAPDLVVLVCPAAGRHLIWLKFKRSQNELMWRLHSACAA